MKPIQMLSKILCGLSLISIFLFAAFNFTWWAPLQVGDFPRGVLLLAIHIYSFMAPWLVSKP